MDRQFYADRPNEKWLTDVTEFHYYTGTNMRKLYLSASWICVTGASFPLSSGTPTTLPWSIALWLRHWRAIPEPALCSTATGAAPIPLRSSMTSWLQLALHRVCPGWESALTTAPWRLLGHPQAGALLWQAVHQREQLVKMIQEYITYYNFHRLQRGLGVRTPMEVHDRLLAA